MCAEKDDRFDLPQMETTPNQTAEDTEDELDLLPEYCNYKDEGCALAKACLECPLPECVYENAGGLTKLTKNKRDEEIRRMRMKENITNREIADRFEVSLRQVYRILAKRDKT